MATVQVQHHSLGYRCGKQIYLPQPRLQVWEPKLLWQILNTRIAGVRRHTIQKGSHITETESHSLDYRCGKPMEMIIQYGNSSSIDTSSVASSLWAIQLVEGRSRVRGKPRRWWRYPAPHIYLSKSSHSLTTVSAWLQVCVGLYISTVDWQAAKDSTSTSTNRFKHHLAYNF